MFLKKKAKRIFSVGEKILKIDPFLEEKYKTTILTILLIYNQPGVQMSFSLNF